MTKHPISKIELKEIADYRGNLSFAEEDAPIPFDIKSVFWGTINKDISLTFERQLFLIVLDGKVNANGELLDRPNQAYLAESNLELNLVSEKATILLVMDKEIKQNDKSTQLENDILQMPMTKDFLGLEGHFANSSSSIPFDIKRVYFTYDIPDNAKRGGHAHQKLTSIIIPIQGKFDVFLDDGNTTTRILLDKQGEGLHIHTKMWRELENFKNKSILIVLASELFSRDDYIWDLQEFRQKHKH